MRYMPMAVLITAAALAVAARRRSRMARDDSRIDGRTFVVTGASSGLGRGVAHELGRRGGNLVLAARRVDVLHEVAREIEAAGGRALVVPTDVSDAVQVEQLVAAAVARFGRVDGWINAAGVGAIGRFEEIPLSDHARVIDINLKGAINGSHVAIALFKRQGLGVLVNVGSVEGKVPVPYHASYTASKHGVLGLGTALHQELRLAGLLGPIRVSTVMPWAVDTPYWVHSANYSGRRAQMVLLDPPRAVVDAIVRAAITPREQVAVGAKAKLACAGHRLAPRVGEHFAANVVHAAQMELAPPATNTAGNLYRPVVEGQGVDGGLRQRMRADRGTYPGGLNPRQAPALFPDAQPGERGAPAAGT